MAPIAEHPKKEAKPVTKVLLSKRVEQPDVDEHKK